MKVNIETSKKGRESFNGNRIKRCKYREVVASHKSKQVLENLIEIQEHGVLIVLLGYFVWLVGEGGKMGNGNFTLTAGSCCYCFVTLTVCCARLFIHILLGFSSSMFLSLAYRG